MNGSLQILNETLRPIQARASTGDGFARELAAFNEFGKATRRFQFGTAESAGERAVEVFVNEFWTSRQRAANSLHEISYRACFKPQLPRFFIERFTQPGAVVYDPFMGRGTTLIEAALLDRVPWGCDANPLCSRLAGPRLAPPELSAVAERLDQIDFSTTGELPTNLLVFFHAETLRKICALKKYLGARRKVRRFDGLDAWIEMVALNRLTGHSPGFFSVYTLPPNQAVSVESQRRINARLRQTPPRRDVRALILKKTRALLADCDADTRATLRSAEPQARLLTAPANATPELPDESVDLVVTSPPFLDTVDYAGDNWLRCWFTGIDPETVSLTIPKRLADWQGEMTAVFRELHRVLKPGGHIAFEVGEVRGGSVKLEESVIPCGAAAGLTPQAVVINDQKFTKTANCWGIANGTLGTNTNRIVVFEKSAPAITSRLRPAGEPSPLHRPQSLLHGA